MTRTDTDQRPVVSALNVQALRRELSRYDFVLGAIPLLLSASAVGAFVGDLPAEPLLATAAVLCMAAIVDVLFVHPPADGTRRESTRSDASDPRRTRRRRTD